MSISNINPGSDSAPLQRYRAVERIEKATPASAAPEQTAMQGRTESRGDRVEISDAGKASQAEYTRVQAREIEHARTALRHSPGLDAERKAEIQERVRQGYYTQDEAVARVAERMLDAVSPPASDR